MSKLIKKELRRIKDEVLNCKKCPLYEERIKNNFFPVIGEGNHNAKIMFIGEAPGLNEAKTGRPFCGAAGKILDELLKSAGIRRKDVYITNVVKDRPPNNRDPKPEEIEAYSLFLERQIEIIKPKIICPLGNYSTTYILGKYNLGEEIQGISKIHGKVFCANNLKIIPLYHPAAGTYNPNMIEIMRNDFQIIKKLKDEI